MHKDETDGGRKVLGKKGLGKLSMFGIGKKITISTVKSGIKNTFVMDYEQLKDCEGNVYKPTVIDYCIKTDEKMEPLFLLSIYQESRILILKDYIEICKLDSIFIQINLLYI